MTNPNGDKSRNERFLDALIDELRTMSDTDALAGESAEDLVKLGERLLKNAREDAGNCVWRMPSASFPTSRRFALQLPCSQWRMPEGTCNLSPISRWPHAD